MKSLQELTTPISMHSSNTADEDDENLPSSASYLQFLQRHAKAVEALETSAKTIGYLLPGRFDGSELLSEFSI